MAILLGLTQERLSIMSKFTYKVINKRIGKEVGSIVEYDHEPCAEFLVCLEEVKPTAKKKLEVATPSDGDVTTQSTQKRPKGSRI
jgi:hypothetical protein